MDAFCCKKAKSLVGGLLMMMVQPPASSLFVSSPRLLPTRVVVAVRLAVVVGHRSEEGAAVGRLGLDRFRIVVVVPAAVDDDGATGSSSASSGGFGLSMRDNSCFSARWWSLKVYDDHARSKNLEKDVEILLCLLVYGNG
jgi:hypothetical protein